ncbi:MAG TPA: thiamine pyrophosphate-binding protein, partial [Xanthobacteraceae bacterium]|nr:thiamine pyrophosphate-binding protein [Xanthobacteraceae bacterium]
MMKRNDCLKVLARHVGDADIVLPVYSAAFDWIDIRPHPLNYLSHGAMGLASSHALGLALGLPDRR